MKYTSHLAILFAVSLCLAPPWSSAETRPEEHKVPAKDATLKKAAETAQESEEARLAAENEAKERKRERERQCIIRPVMSDAEMARCKAVWR